MKACGDHIRRDESALAPFAPWSPHIVQGGKSKGSERMAEFDFAAKNKWRVWAWGTIAGRLSTAQRKRAGVLYLPGTKDLDRSVALNYGFTDCNLIGVDKSKDVCRSVRAFGGYCIWGDFLAVLACWPRHIPIHVIFADLCCGLERQLFDVQGLKSSIAISDGIKAHLIVAINLQRGRDPSSNALRSNLNELSNELPVLYSESNPLHRGRQFLDMFNFVRIGSSSLDVLEEMVTHPQFFRSNTAIKRYKSMYRRHHRARFYSYPHRYDSGSVTYMDSAVFNLHLNPTAREKYESRKEATDIEDLRLAVVGNQRKYSRIKRQIAATLAIRTMRIAA